MDPYLLQWRLYNHAGKRQREGINISPEGCNSIITMAATTIQMNAEKLCAPEKPSPILPAYLGSWGPTFLD
jgi:hypothetical protein